MKRIDLGGLRVVPMFGTLLPAADLLPIYMHMYAAMGEPMRRILRELGFQ